ncbi:hypothetical protein VP01_1361g1 [Puccinia sorghi]|uniref:DDE Tnp4 domain-containing protein n=1 Tax=Puccinia sorghi TaxID=27349 RepID=A0A0L6VLW4_9BASI|nr:hypothetical protein VP01_1361g1 [Puccinia sorghi]
MAPDCPLDDASQGFTLTALVCEFVKLNKPLVHWLDGTIALQELNKQTSVGVKPKSTRHTLEKDSQLPSELVFLSTTHIPIKIPPNTNWKWYINHKSWLLKVFECVVDGDGNFQNFDYHGAGSMHDSRLFRCSILQSLRPGSCVAPMIPWGTFLVGNAAYPTNMNILLPYPSVVNLENKWFNYCQSSTCIVNQLCKKQHFFISSNVTELDSATGLSMMAKREIISDVLYRP